MDDAAKGYSCGPAITDHDWASTPPCGCPTMQLGNNEKAALLDAETGCQVICNWCPVTLELIEYDNGIRVEMVHGGQI